jgi:hypothetical protein
VTTPVRFRFRLVDSGWAAGHIAIADASAEAEASYLSDALRNLIRAVRLLFDGATEARTSWHAEPGEYRWIFRRGGRTVRLLLLSFYDWTTLEDFPDTPPDTEGTVLLDVECELSDLGRAVVAGAQQVLDEHGVKGYRDEWVRYPFPAGELSALERSLDQYLAECAARSLAARKTRRAPWRRM